MKENHTSVEWLPKEKCEQCKNGCTYAAPSLAYSCPCKCHKEKTAKQDKRCPKCKEEGEPSYFCCYERNKREETPFETTSRLLVENIMQYYTLAEVRALTGHNLCPKPPEPERCCIGFKLDGVLLHECKEHKPYCAKEWPCNCHPRDSYTKEEIDERLEELTRILLENAFNRNMFDAATGALEAFRSRFL